MRPHAPGYGYRPFWYTRRIKRPGGRYVLRGIVQDDFAFWLLAVAWHGHWLLQGLGLAALLVSFWCIYELGYRENDRVAARYERYPKLAKNYYRHAGDFCPGFAPWGWMAASAALGVACLTAARGQLDAAHLSVGAMNWVALLLATRACFALFNYSPKRARVGCFPLLQLARNFAPAVVMPVTGFGAALLVANTLTRTVGYCIYRLAGHNRWPRYPVATLRLAIVLGLGGLIVLAVPAREAGGYVQAVAIVLWCGYRASRESNRPAFG